MNEDKLTTVAVNVPPEILWTAFFILLLIIGFFSWVLIHHWSYYGIKGNNKIFAKSLYFIGLVTFFVISVLLLGSYDFL